jgi:hypothetical protein
MAAQLRRVLSDPALAEDLRDRGLRLIRERHSCRHRVQELLDFYGSLKQTAEPAQRTEAA